MHLQAINDNLFASIQKKSNEDNLTNQDYTLTQTLKEFCKSDIFKYFTDHLHNLQSFLNHIEIEHGEIPLFLSKSINENIVQKIKEISQIYEFCNQNNFQIQHDFACLSKIIVSCIDAARYNSFGNPEKTKIYTRFLSEDKRWHARSTKTKQIISKKSNLSISRMEAGELSSVYHNSDCNKQILSDLQSKKKYFELISCSHMASSLDKAIDRVNEAIMFEKYGFQRVSLSKLLFLLETNFNYSNACIVPVAKKSQFENKEVERFIDVCENFNFGGKRFPIFDHYAEIKLDDKEFSVLVGEIDMKSYFICYNFGD